MTINDFYIEALDQGDTAWRIDWFGHLAYPNRTVRWTRPSICIAISAATTDEEPPTGNTPQREIWLSIGLLTVLRVGDIWKNGRLFATPDYELETFPDIPINQETMITIKAGVSPDGEEFFLPLRQHPWHARHTQSFCEVVSMPNGHKIVVPCWELIRFYFGSSANFLERLVRPDLEPKSLFSKKVHNSVRGHLHLELALGIVKNSASDIARIAGSPDAWHAVARISASCLKSASRANPIYPHTHFPFKGVTTLTATGKWITRNGQEKSTFVVSNLRSCSHPFPFKTLSYRLAGMKEKSLSPLLSPSQSKQKNYRLTVGVQKQKTTIREEDPDRNMSSSLRLVASQHRFPDLQRKSICHLSAVAKDNNNLITPLVRTPSPCWNATGDPVSSRQIRAVDIATDTTTCSCRPSHLPAFLKEAIQVLQVSPESTIELLYPGGQDSPIFQIPVIADEDGVIPDEVFVDSDTAQQRSRLAVALFLQEKWEAEMRLELVIVVEPRTPQTQSAIGRSEWSIDCPVTFDALTKRATWVAIWGTSASDAGSE